MSMKTTTAVMATVFQLTFKFPMTLDLYHLLLKQEVENDQGRYDQAD